MTLLTIFGADKDVLDLSHPIRRGSPIRFLRDGPLVRERIQPDGKEENASDGQALFQRHLLPLISLAPDKMKIHAPPDRIAGIGGVIRPEGKVTFLPRFFYCDPEIRHVPNFRLIDFFDDGSHFDAGIVGAGVPDHLKHGDSLRFLQLQLFPNILVHRSDHYTKLLTQPDRLVLGHGHGVGRCRYREGAARPGEANETEGQGATPTAPERDVYESMASNSDPFTGPRHRRST